MKRFLHLFFTLFFPWTYLIRVSHSTICTKLCAVNPTSVALGIVFFLFLFYNTWNWLNRYFHIYRSWLFYIVSVGKTLEELPWKTYYCLYWPNKPANVLYVVFDRTNISSSHRTTVVAIIISSVSLANENSIVVFYFPTPKKFRINVYTIYVQCTRTLHDRISLKIASRSLDNSRRVSRINSSKSLSCPGVSKNERFSTPPGQRAV